MKVPKEIIELVKANRIIFSQKAQEQLEERNFTINDLKYSILNGEVLKKEKDETKKARYKYTILGPSKSGKNLYSCGKIISVKGKIYFVITFHGGD